MWSYCVQFLDDCGNVLKTRYLPASGSHHALREALRGEGVPEDYADIEVTRLS